jgi:hypothetical protein
MSEKKEIKINLNIIKTLLGAFIISLICVFIIQLFGNFSYIPGSKCIYFSSFTINEYANCNYEIYNLEFTTRVVTYIFATLKSYDYIIILTIILSLIKTFLNNFKFTFK